MLNSNAMWSRIVKRNAVDTEQSDREFIVQSQSDYQISRDADYQRFALEEMLRTGEI